MSYENDVRPYLEGAYFVSGVLLLIGVWFASRQIRLFKEEAARSSTRAAKEKAIEASIRFSECLVPKVALENAAREAHGIAKKKPNVVDFHPDEIKKSPAGSDKSDFTSAILDVMNELDAIAAYFVTGVADEKTGFKIFGLSYCDCVEDRYEYIAFNRNGKEMDYLDHLVALYKLWRPRIQAADLKAEVSALQAQIAHLERRDRKAGRESTKER